MLPFCLLNIGNIFLASYVKRNYLNQFGVGISLSAFQSSLSIVIAFLSVTRVRIAFEQFVKHRAAIQQMARARYDEYLLMLLDLPKEITDIMKLTFMLYSRNVVFYSVAFTRKEHSEKAKHWRLNVARETMALLRLAVTGKNLLPLIIETNTSHYSNHFISVTISIYRKAGKNVSRIDK